MKDALELRGVGKSLQSIRVFFLRLFFCGTVRICLLWERSRRSRACGCVHETFQLVETSFRNQLSYSLRPLTWESVKLSPKFVRETIWVFLCHMMTLESDAKSGNYLRESEEQERENKLRSEIFLRRAKNMCLLKRVRGHLYGWAYTDSHATKTLNDVVPRSDYKLLWFNRWLSRKSPLDMTVPRQNNQRLK